MVSKRAAEYLAADLRAVQLELEALDNGLREMEAKREAVRIKFDLLKKAIGPDSQVELPLPKEASTVLTSVVPVPIPTEELPHTTPVEPVGFRVAIRSVLTDAVRGMRSKDVHAELIKRGVPFKGRVEPATRTYQELYRMAKQGQIRRRAGLYYAIQQPQAHAVQ